MLKWNLRPKQRDFKQRYYIVHIKIMTYKVLFSHFSSEKNYEKTPNLFWGYVGTLKAGQYSHIKINELTHGEREGNNKHNKNKILKGMGGAMFSNIQLGPVKMQLKLYAKPKPWVFLEISLSR